MEQDWDTVQDAASGRQYYVHKRTRRVTWTDPNSRQTSEWVEYDGGGGKYFYMNRGDRTTTWTKPESFDADASADAWQRTLALFAAELRAG